MTNKVLVELSVPLIEEEFEVWFPINKKIKEVISLLCKSINDLTGGYYTPVKDPCLYDKVTGKKIDITLNVKDADIKNGSELILI